MILVDLDGFTGVNDMAGPSAGDLVLAQVARRLRAVVPPRGTVARWGGDEFAVLVTGAASAQEITELAERILASVTAEPYRAADRAVSLSASVGVALADGSPAGYVWRNADAAVSRAKEAGGGRLEVYAALPHGDVRRRLQLAAELSRALAEGELELEYQPMADLASSRVIGVTALPRWRRDGTDLPRTEFLDVAETSGVIVELGDWMLRESLRPGGRLVARRLAGQRLAALLTAPGPGAAVHRVCAGGAVRQRPRPARADPGGGLAGAGRGRRRDRARARRAA